MPTLFQGGYIANVYKGVIAGFPIPSGGFKGEPLNTLCDIQWGFTKGKSTTGALLAATDQWHQMLDDGLEICAVFFDYSKAFDSVPH